MFTATVLVMTCFLSVFSPFCADEKSTISKSELITVAELRDHVFFLSSDYLGGRIPGAKGYEIAVEYAACQFRQAGLKPILKSTEGKETFFQKVPIVKKTIVAANPLTLMRQTGRKSFSNKSLKFVDLNRPEILGSPLPIVFVGYGIEEPEYNWNDFEGLDLRGKIVVILMGAPTKDGKPVLPKDIHNKYLSIQGMVQKLERLVAKRQTASILLIEDEELSELGKVIIDKVGFSYIFYEGDESYDLNSKEDNNLAIIKDNLGKELFEGQEFNPYDPDIEDLQGYKTYELNAVDLLFDFKIVEERIVSRNLIAIVPGTDPELSQQYIAVGAHLDHIQPIDGQICNGADDNSSGSAGVIEIAESIAMNPPRRTVLFCLFTAEEAQPHPRVGSRHFLVDCPVPLDDIQAYLNLDVISRTDTRILPQNTHLVVGSDKINPELKQIIKSVNEKTVEWSLEFERGEYIFETSDHLSFHHKRIPVAHFSSGYHEEIHTPGDDPEKINFENIQKISQLIYMVTMELANREQILRK